MTKYIINKAQFNVKIILFAYYVIPRSRINARHKKKCVDCCFWPSNHIAPCNCTQVRNGPEREKSRRQYNYVFKHLLTVYQWKFLKTAVTPFTYTFFFLFLGIQKIIIVELGEMLWESNSVLNHSRTPMWTQQKRGVQSGSPFSRECNRWNFPPAFSTKVFEICPIQLER